MMLRPQPRPTFYPPRAGALHGAWSAWYAFRRWSHLQLPNLPAIAKPVGLTWQNLRVILIPTYAWVAVGRRQMALKAAILYAASAVTAILCLGLDAAGWAAGMMITVHGLGIAEYFFSGKLQPRLVFRFARHASVLLALAFVYSFASRQLLATIVVPLQTDHGAFLINVWSRPNSLTRDEIVAFRRGDWRSRHYMIPAGTYLGQVIGLPGDVITFHVQTFAVNGQSHPRRRGMPKQGELTVPANRTFIWPFDMRTELQYEKEAADFAQKSALVPDADLVGRPFRRWFFRTQNYEPPR